MKDSEQTPTKRQPLPVRWVEEADFELTPKLRAKGDTSSTAASHILVREETQTAFLRRQQSA